MQVVAERERAHALAEMREAIREVSFPATKDDVRDVAGNARIPLPDGRLLFMTDVLDRVGEHDFGTRQRFEVEAGRAWENLVSEKEKQA